MSKQKYTATEMQHVAHYITVLNRWPKMCGDKPTPELFARSHVLCVDRPGKHGLACAMYQRDGGASDAQVKRACGMLTPDKAHKQTSLFNRARDAVDAKLFTRDMNAPRGVWHLVLAPLGQKLLDKAAAKAAAAPIAEPVKKAKAKKAKAAHKPRAKKPVAPVVSDAPVIVGDAPLSADSVLIPAQQS